MLTKVENIVTYWDANPRKKSQDVIDGLYVNMSMNGFDESYPLAVYQFNNDARYHLTDGHHRYDAAIMGGISEVPVVITQGTPDEHYESIQLANMVNDVSHGNIAQMFKPSEKREAVKALLTLPKYWERSNRWLAEEFRISLGSINTWRDNIGEQICSPSNELGLPEDRLEALHNLILKAERVSKDGQVQPVRDCKLRAALLGDSQSQLLPISMVPGNVAKSKREVDTQQRQPEVTDATVQKVQDKVQKLEVDLNSDTVPEPDVSEVPRMRIEVPIEEAIWHNAFNTFRSAGGVRLAARGTMEDIDALKAFFSWGLREENNARFERLTEEQQSMARGVEEGMRKLFDSVKSQMEYLAAIEQGVPDEAFKNSDWRE